MYSINSVQPQIFVPSLTSIFNAVRTTAQSVSAGRRNRNDNSVSLSTKTEKPITTRDLKDTFATTLTNLGISKDSYCLTVEEITPKIFREELAASSAPFISANTFFENKNGFSKGDLLATKSGSCHFQSFKITLPHLATSLRSPQVSPSIFHQSSRGFKTKRHETATGFGQQSKAVETNMSSFKDSVLDKMHLGSASTSKKKRDERLENVLLENESDPKLAEKIKIAFAEGYIARESEAKEKPQNKGFFDFMYKTYRVFLVALTLFCVVQIYRAMDGSPRLNVLKGERHEISPEEIDVTFDDVKGADEAKAELQDIVQYLREPEKFKVLGAKLPSGVLLVGPPGMGKTLLARAVAGEAGVPFFHASGSEFDEVFVGTGAKRVRVLFETAKIKAPCVIFIDEIDTVGAKRTSSQIHPYANQTINQLLSEMDGFKQTEGVIVLGATNRKDTLDKALLRPGRFDVEVHVSPPDLKGRKEILELYAKEIIMGDDVNIEILAKGTIGWSGADLKNMINQAALKAAMEGAPCVSMQHMDFAKDKISMGPEKKTKIPDQSTNLNTAYHEAGHALVAYYTKEAIPVNKITILPRGGSLGHTSFIPEKEQYSQNKAELMARMDVAMGGRIGEEFLEGPERVTTGASQDFKSATQIATMMVKHWGMSEKCGVRSFSQNDDDLSPATKELVDTEIKRLLQESYDRAKAILNTHKREHKALANALMKYETLEAADLEVIASGKTLSKPLPTVRTNKKPAIPSKKKELTETPGATTTNPL